MPLEAAKGSGDAFQASEKKQRGRWSLTEPTTVVLLTRPTILVDVAQGGYSRKTMTELVPLGDDSNYSCWNQLSSCVQVRITALVHRC